MNFFYSCLCYLTLPFWWIRLWRERLPHHPFRERFGRIPFYTDQRVLWLHGASVGEMVTVAPVIRVLLEDHPTHRIVITCMTATGVKRAEALFGSEVSVHFSPIDLPGATKRFIKRLRPELCIIIETELWPNLINATAQAATPMVLINARLSPKSFSRYRRMPRFTLRMLQHFNWIAAKSREDAQRFRALGVSVQRMNVVGSLKFDVHINAHLLELAQALREQFGQRTIWIAASTHPNEEALVLKAHQDLLAKMPSALLVLVPRHPQRFEAVARLCEKMFSAQSFAQRSKEQLPNLDTEVYLADSMGELMALYGTADIAFVGGSLVAIGGHNLIEPASWRLSIITGPYLGHVEEMVALLEPVEALNIVHSTAQLTQTLIRLFNDPQTRIAQGKAAWEVVEKHQGVQRRINRQLNRLIPLEALAS